MRKDMLRGVVCKVAGAVLAVAVACGSVAVPASAHTLAETQFTQVPGTMLYVSNGASANAAIHVQEYLSVPINVLTKLVSANCKIYLDTTAEDTGVTTGSAIPTGTYVAGMFYGTYIDILSDLDVTEQMNMIHEIGHFVDYNSLGGYKATKQAFPASSTAQWQTIWQAEGPVVATLSLTSSVNAYNATEYFATAFAWYVKNPAVLAKVAPQSYAYVDSMVKAIK